MKISLWHVSSSHFYDGVQQAHNLVTYLLGVEIIF